MNIRVEHSAVHATSAVSQLERTGASFQAQVASCHAQLQSAFSQVASLLAQIEQLKKSRLETKRDTNEEAKDGIVGAFLSLLTLFFFGNAQEAYLSSLSRLEEKLNEEVAFYWAAVRRGRELKVHIDINSWWAHGSLDPWVYA